jgi:hypothetical protein
LNLTVRGVIGLTNSIEIVLLLRLITAHLLVDFILQSGSWVRQRSDRGWKSRWLFVHGVLAGAVAYCLAARWDAIWLLPTIAVTHILFDGLKAMSKETARIFILDQAAHLAVILICWVVLAGVGLTKVAEVLGSCWHNPEIWLVVTGYLTVTLPVGVLVGKVTHPWREVGKGLSHGGMERAGMWIGCLERVLILTFVMFGRFEAVGFLIAAKSIFRFGGRDAGEARSETEYFLVGTLTSFAAAIAVGLLMSWRLVN